MKRIVALVFATACAVLWSVNAAQASFDIFWWLKR